MYFVHKYAKITVIFLGFQLSDSHTNWLIIIVIHVSFKEGGLSFFVLSDYDRWNNSCTKLNIAYFTLLIGFQICTYNWCLYIITNVLTHSNFTQTSNLSHLLYNSNTKTFHLEKNLTNPKCMAHYFLHYLCINILCRA